MFEKATPVAVTEGETTGGIDGALEEYGHITGTVTASKGGAPLAQVFVMAYKDAGDFWEPVSWAETAEDGTYNLGGLDTGTYRVEFFDGSGEHAYEFYNNAAAITRASDIKVVLSQTTAGISAALDPGAKLSGTVKADATGEPIEDVVVWVFRNNGAGWEQFLGIPTQEDGTYELGGLRNGSYRVMFEAWTGTYATEFYNNKPTLRNATAVAVREGATRTGINAGLALSGGIAGTVTDSATGETLAGVQVTAFMKTANGWESAWWTETAMDGTYELPGMPPGSYRVEFMDYNGTYVLEYYNGKATLAKANDVVVKAGTTTSGIDATLDEGGRISGTITAAADGAPVSGCWVSVLQQVGSTWQWVTGGEADAEGNYTVGGLRTGTYKVMFFDVNGVYAWEFWDGKGTAAKANPVSVTMGATTSGINATLDPGSTISGTVTAAAGGAPLGGTYVTVYTQIATNQWEPVAGAETNPDGTYAVTGLRAGSYKVEFWDPYDSYASEYYNNKPTLAKANTVSVGTAATVTGINAALEAAPATAAAAAAPSKSLAVHVRPSLRPQLLRR